MGTFCVLKMSTEDIFFQFETRTVGDQLAKKNPFKHTCD